MENKFRLEDVSVEEQKSFQQELTALLDKGSYYFEPVPQYSRVMIKDTEGKDVLGWMTVNTFLLQKKVPIANESSPVTEPVIKDAEIVSPLSDEMTGNEPA